MAGAAGGGGAGGGRWARGAPGPAGGGGWARGGAPRGGRRRGAAAAPGPPRPPRGAAAGPGELPGPAALCRGAPRAGGVRPAPVRQVSGAGGPGAAGVGRTRRRLLHQDRPAPHPHRPAPGSRGGGPPAGGGALEVAWRRAAAGELDHKGVDGGDFWAVAAEQRLAPLLFTAARAELGMDAVVRWAYGQGARELYETISQLIGSAGDERELEDAHSAYDAVRAFEAQADRTRSSIEATAQGLLRAYRFARVVRSADSCEITADELLDGAA